MNDLAITDSDPIFLGALVIVAIIFAIIIVVFPLWIALHHKLAKLDSVLLREPFFSKTEQINCMVWPLSYLKTVNYIGLIAAPGYAKKVRFRNFDEELPVSKTTVVACKVQFTLMCFSGIMFLVYAGYLLFGLYVYPNL